MIKKRIRDIIGINLPLQPSVSANGFYVFSDKQTEDFIG